MRYATCSGLAEEARPGGNVVTMATVGYGDVHPRFTPLGQQPLLPWLIEGQQQLHGLRWRDLAQRLHRDSHRHTIQRHLLEVGKHSAVPC